MFGNIHMTGKFPSRIGPMWGLGALKNQFTPGSTHINFMEELGARIFETSLE